MAEPKRIIPTQIESAEPGLKKENVSRNVRFTLSLVESTERRCPEYSYIELLKNALVSVKMLSLFLYEPLVHVEQIKTRCHAFYSVEKCASLE